MSRSELVEWVIMILCIVLWWPIIFAREGSIWFSLVSSAPYLMLARYGVPVVLVAIFVRRYRRMKAGLEYSEGVVRAQRSGLPFPPGEDPEQKR